MRARCSGVLTWAKAPLLLSLRISASSSSAREYSVMARSILPWPIHASARLMCVAATDSSIASACLKYSTADLYFLSRRATAPRLFSADVSCGSYFSAFPNSLCASPRLPSLSSATPSLL